MKKINLIYDVTHLSEYVSYSQRTGIFFVMWNTLIYFLENHKYKVYLYCDPRLKGQLYQFFGDTIKKYHCKMVDDTLLEQYNSKVINYREKRQKAREEHKKLRKCFCSVKIGLYKILRELARPFCAKDCYAKIHAYFSPLYAAPDVIKQQEHIKRFIFVYDAIPVIFPQYFPGGTDRTHWFFKFIDSLDKDDYLIAISQSTKDDFIKYVPNINPEHISVAHLAADKTKFYPASKEAINKTLEKYGIEPNTRYVFSLCTLEPRKNLIMSVKAFVEFIKRYNIKDMYYLMGGGHWEHFIEQLNSEISDLNQYTQYIKRLGYVDDEDLAPLYSGAEFFVYTSQYEGFGLPLLEAMQCGCPVITGDNSSLPEVVGDAGVYVNAFDKTAHVDAYKTLYDNKELREDMQKKSLIQSEKFTWAKTRAMIDGVIRENARKTKGNKMSFLYKTKKVNNKHIIYVLGIPVITVRIDGQTLRLHFLGVRIFKHTVEKVIEKVEQRVSENTSSISSQHCIDSLVNTIEKIGKIHLDTCLPQMYDTSDFNKKELKGKSVVQFSTWQVVCGIASFAQALQRGLDKLNVLKKNDVIALDRSIVNHNSYAENEQYLQNIIEKMAGYDVIVLQHEWSLYLSDKYELFQSIQLFANFVKRITKTYKKAKVVVYLHTSPDILYQFRQPESNLLIESFNMLAEMDRVSFIANTPHIVKELYKYNINSALGVDPIKESVYPKIINETQNVVRQNLHLKDGDIVIAMLGMINVFKRHYEMVNMLAKLPENYKLLIIGGVPEGEEETGKKLEKAISDNMLEERVFVTGRFRDEDLYTYLSMADIMAAPYSNLFKFGSSSVPGLLQTQKPLVAYDIDSVSLLNKQCSAKPITVVEYDNSDMFIEKIKELSENQKMRKSAINEIKKYTAEISEEKLAKLLLKTADINKKSKIKVLYDISILGEYNNKGTSRSGIFWVALNLFKQLCSNQNVELYLYSSKPEASKSFLQDFSETSSKLDLYTGNVLDMDVFLSPIFKVPDAIKQTGIPCFTIIHDVIPMVLPEYSAGMSSWFGDMFRSLNADDYCFSNSDYTKKDFLKYRPELDADKITTIPLATNLPYKPNKNLTAEIREKYNIPANKKYLFSLCSLEPRKNLIRAVKCFVEFIKKNKINDLVFVLGGGACDGFFERIKQEILDFDKYEDKIIRAGYVDDKDMEVLYSNAEWFVYTSQYEGFGMPPLEAMACGTAVITSNNTALPEVVSNAGQMIDWDSDEQHIAAYEKYYFDKKYRDKMAAEGLKRSKRFSWEKTMDKILDTFEKTNSVPVVPKVTKKTCWTASELNGDFCNNGVISNPDENFNGILSFGPYISTDRGVHNVVVRYDLTENYCGIVDVVYGQGCSMVVKLELPRNQHEFRFSFTLDTPVDDLEIRFFGKPNNTDTIDKDNKFNVYSITVE